MKTDSRHELENLISYLSRRIQMEIDLAPAPDGLLSLASAIRELAVATRELERGHEFRKVE